MYTYIIIEVGPVFCRGVSMYRTRDVVDMAMRGIPEIYRSEIWMVYSGTYIRSCGCGLSGLIGLVE